MAVHHIDRDTLLRRIKETVLRFDPEAQVILYGSRARGDAAPDSDWDVVVISPRKKNWEDEDRILDAMYEVELDAGAVIIPIVYSPSEWNVPLRKGSPFYRNVTREGVVL